MVLKLDDIIVRIDLIHPLSNIIVEDYEVVLHLLEKLGFVVLLLGARSFTVVRVELFADKFFLSVFL